MIPMKYGSADVGDLDGYCTDDRYAMEQKLDGTRALVEIRPTGVRFVTHSGRTLTHAAAAQHFAALTEALAPLVDGMTTVGATLLILDGEILTDTGVLWLFDAPEIPGACTIDSPFVERRKALEDLYALTLSPSRRVRLTPCAIGTEAKRDLAQRVIDAGAEGVMVKPLDSTYEPGVRTKKCLKVKLVKTADVYVIARNVGPAGTLNAHLAVKDSNGEEVMIGACSMIGKPDAQVGDVVEVRYLYLGTGGRLYQPTLLRLRGDRDPASCRFDQFRIVSKAVLGG